MTAATPLPAPEPYRFHEITIYCAEGGADHPVVVPGELTMAQGVALTPRVHLQGGLPRFVDGYTLTHMASGKVLLNMGEVPTEFLHVLADELGKSGIEWTAPGEVLTGARSGEVMQALKTAKTGAERRYFGVTPNKED